MHVLTEQHFVHIAIRQREQVTLVNDIDPLDIASDSSFGLTEW